MARTLSVVLAQVPEQRQDPARQIILANLRAFNRQSIGVVERRSLTLTLSLDDDLIGGLMAETFMGWLSIDGLWVAEGHRDRGHATALLDEAEQEGWRRGATDCVLDTFSFQAPGFYRQRGYREFGRLEGFPVGHHRHYLTKSL